ncbi:MAG TPA: VOC family protein [Burkholderiaceae bacterium]|nr:VOC family protein [Burkholderiaceae bacterium]
MRCEPDHLVVACRDLAQGAAWLRERLGVDPQAGGKHATMGTHNALLKLGARAYLELLAIDPDAPAPARPRWFDLDNASVAERAAQAPFFLTWVARTEQIANAVTRVPALGEVQAFTRGQFAWRLTVPEDGALQFGGLLPAVIQWESATHPADVLEERGCTLSALRLSHPAATSLVPLFRELRVTGPVDLKPGPKSLVADIVCPHGVIAVS